MRKETPEQAAVRREWCAQPAKARKMMKDSVKQARHVMGVSKRRFRKLLRRGDTDAMAHLRTAAEDNGLGDDERDWENFFAQLIKFIEMLMPLIMMFGI